MYFTRNNLQEVANSARKIRQAATAESDFTERNSAEAIAPWTLELLVHLHFLIYARGDSLFQVEKCSDPAVTTISRGKTILSRILISRNSKRADEFSARSRILRGREKERERKGERKHPGPRILHNLSKGGTKACANENKSLYELLAAPPRRLVRAATAVMQRCRVSSCEHLCDSGDRYDETNLRRDLTRQSDLCNWLTRASDRISLTHSWFYRYYHAISDEQLQCDCRYAAIISIDIVRGKLPIVKIMKRYEFYIYNRRFNKLQRSNRKIRKCFVLLILHLQSYFYHLSAIWVFLSNPSFFTVLGIKKSRQNVIFQYFYYIIE